jgi:hypothetical protein
MKKTLNYFRPNFFQVEQFLNEIQLGHCQIDNEAPTVKDWRGEYSKFVYLRHFGFIDKEYN